LTHVHGAHTEQVALMMISLGEGRNHSSRGNGGSKVDGDGAP
jgi:hypothetical protein